MGSLPTDERHKFLQKLDKLILNSDLDKSIVHGIGLIIIDEGNYWHDGTYMKTRQRKQQGDKSR